MLAAITPRFRGSLGGFDCRHTPSLRTDVLVLGGGIAGCAAALSAADAGASVVLLSKAPLTESNTAYAQGGLAAVVGAGDSAELHVRDTLSVGAGMSDAEVARSIITESAGTVRWLEHLGVQFDHRDGALSLSREGGHSVSRVVHHGDATGAEIQRALQPAVAGHPRIACRTDTFVRDLLLHEGRCVGAVVLDGDTEIGVEAGAVVVATGGAGQVYRETTNPIGACGDGLALCFRAGATLADLEFVQFHPTTLYIAGASRFLISEIVRGAGAILRDRDGNRFMQSVHPSAELAPRDVVSRAILERMVATGDTHVYLDLSAVADPHAAFPTISRICRGFDIDIARDPIPVRPGAHYMIGGVRADLDGRTDVDGLLAAGEVAATGLHGANRLASNSLLEGAVIGHRAGREACRASAAGSPGLPRSTPARPLGDNAPKIHLDDMLYSLKSLMWRNVGLRRQASGLDEALQRIGLWNHYLDRANPRTRHGHELSNMLLVSALVTAAAQARDESRGTHYRTDHPDRDDAAWCRRICLRRHADGGIATAIGELLDPSDQAAA